MRSRDQFLILGVAAGLALAVALVVTNLGSRKPAERPAQLPVAAQDDGNVQEAALEAGASSAHAPEVARTRATSEVSDEASFVDPKRRREGRQREAEFLAQFVALGTEQGAAALEKSVREVLDSGREPLSRKVAGLRALHSAGVPGTDAVLLAAVEGQADLSDGFSLSAPRSALKLLFERAPSGEDARRVLARIAFIEETRVSADLRRRASAALAASIQGKQHDEVVRLLRLEASSAQLDAALQALARDANFSAAKSSVK